MNKPWKPPRFLVKFLKVIGWIILSVVLLLIIVAVAIQIPAIQNRITQKAVSFLQNKIGTEVRLDHISLSFPKKIVLQGLYIEDQSKDTLLYAGRLAVNTNLLGLLRNRIQLSSVRLDDLTAKISREEKDSVFNFDYIVQAFAGEPSAPADTTSKPWDFSLGDVSLYKTSVLYQDSLTGNDVALDVGMLEINSDVVDPIRSVYRVDDITLSDVKASVVQTKEPFESIDTSDVALEKPEPLALDLGFHTINLNTIEVAYTHQVSGEVIRLDLNEAVVKAEEIDLKKHILHLDNVTLNNTFLSYHQMVTKGKDKNVAGKTEHTDTVEHEEPWSIRLNALHLAGNALQYYDFNYPVQKEGMDPHHLWISDLTTEATGIKMDSSTMAGDLSKLSFSERNGLTVTSCQASFTLDDRSLVLKDLVFQTPGTRIGLRASASFRSFASLARDYPEARISFDLPASVIALKDVLYLYPALRDSLPLTLPPSSVVKVDASADGLVKDLVINRFNVQALDQTVLRSHGSVRGLPDFRHTHMDITLEKLFTTNGDVTSLLPDSLLKSVAVPAWINLEGKFNGTVITPNVSATVSSSIGSVVLNTQMNLDSTYKKENYRGDLRVKDLHLGKLLRQEETIGPLNMKATVEGKGVTIDEIDAMVNVTVDSVEYNQYTYRNFRVNGSLKRYFFSGTALLEDENLNLELEGDLDYNEAVPHYEFTFDLKNADFKALHLTERPLKMRGALDVNLATADFKVINGNLTIRKVAVYNGEDLYAVDSLLFASVDQKGQSEIKIESDIISGNFKGTISLYSLPEVLKRHFNNYFALSDTAFKKPADVQNFEFGLVIKNTDLLTEILVPELEPFVPGEIAGEFNSLEDKLNLRLNLTKLKYSGIGVDSVSFIVLSDKQSLDYTFALSKVVLDTMRIGVIKLAGNVAQDSLRTNLFILDSLQQEKYFLGGVFNSEKETFQFRFLRDQLTLNYKEWQAPPDNMLRFTRRGLDPHNFAIYNEREKVSIVSRNDRDSTLSVVFDSLNLSSITSLVEGTAPAAGVIQGDLNIGVAEKGAFNSSLAIHELTIFDHLWGDLRLLLGRTSTGPLNIDARLEGENAEVKAAGYLTQASNEIHFTTDITRLELEAVEPLTMGQLKELKGSLTGRIDVNGKTDQPDINGRLTFREASFRATYVNSVFTIQDETLAIERSGLTFTDFEIIDQNKNKAAIDGTVSTSTFTEFDLDLNVTADNFQVLNTTAEDNDLFYGKVSISTATKINGTSNQPKVQMDVSLSQESNLTYVVPQSEKGVLEQKGIVVFVDKDAKGDPFLAGIDPRDTVKATFRGIDLTANIELTDTETFSVIIDPITGDKLTVKGNSTLTFGMDPSGDMTLSGRYEISEGTYNLSFYKLVKRNFSIERGSYMTWSGDPLNADMNIRAIYQVEASPMELVSSQLVSSSQGELNTYRQRLPFLVYLQIRGELLTPEISFELDMPESDRNALGGIVYAKIKDINTRESDLNKQVFALLILKRFITDNPFESQGGSDVASTARRSVSKLLTEQLNRLSENVKGVELSFDVKSYEDYSTGEAQGQTELQLGLSKTLFNDRLVVKVSGNVDVEGETSDQSFTDYIGDLALEYKLTEDGRFRITGFRNSNYDMIDGELIETGAGLIYIKDYDTLRELFKANAKEGQ